VSEPLRDTQASLRDTHAPRSVLRSVPVFEGRVFSVVTDEVDLGDEVVVRDLTLHPGAVAIIAYREPGEVLILRQYRHPVGAELWEPPAGLLDVAGEDPWVAARRELAEEADLHAATWHVLADVYSSPGGSSEAIRMYLARDLTPVPEDERFEREAEERDMEVRWVPLDEALAAVLDGRLGSPTSVIGFLAVEAARARGWSTLRPADAPWAARPV
jgi:ADP-ribose pyrophosphatase